VLEHAQRCPHGASFDPHRLDLLTPRKLWRSRPAKLCQSPKRLQ
jgi:hypothetical protein